MVVLAAPSEIVVYELDSSGFEPRQTQLLEHALLTEVNKRDGIRAIGIQEARERAAFEEPSGCEPRDCLAGLVDAIGTDHVITGRVARLGSTTAITLRLINLRESELVTSSVRQLTKSEGQGILAALGPMVAELLPQLDLGAGYSSGVSEQLRERWEPAPLSPTPFYVSLASTAVFAGVATGFALSAQSTKRELEDLIVNSSPENPASGAETVQLEDDFDASKNAANLFWVATAAGAVTTSVLFFLTDFEGDESVYLTPMPSGGISAGATFRF